jgi:uncharacterized protein YgbK (DUF1537 family)
MKLLVVANRTIRSDEVRDAIVDRAAAGPVHVTLVAPASIGAAPAPARRTAMVQRLERARRTATAQHLERAVQQLREAGVAVEGVVGGDPDLTVAGQLALDPSRFDEVVVSCSPWVSCVRPRSELGPAG